MASAVDNREPSDDRNRGPGLEGENPAALNGTESQLAIELNKCIVVQRATGVCQGLIDSSDTTRYWGKKAIEIHVDMYGRIICTGPGKKADEMVAKAARHVRKSTGKCINCPGNTLKKMDENPMFRQMHKFFNLFCRYFFPLLLLRWTVDLWLMAAEISLALVMDLDRIGGKMASAADDFLDRKGKRAGKSPERSPGRQGAGAPCSPANGETTPKETPEKKDAAEANHTGSPKSPAKAEPAADGQHADDGRADSPRNTPKVAGDGQNPGDGDGPGDGDRRPRDAGSSPRQLRTRRAMASMARCPCYSIFLRGLLRLWVLSYDAFDVLASMFVIPYLTMQVVILARVSLFLRSLSGMVHYYGYDTRADKRQIKLIYMHFSPCNRRRRRPAPPALKTDEWLVDFVLDRCVCELMKYTFVSNVLETTGVKRPVRIFSKFGKAIKKHFEGEDLVPYLRVGADYDEDRDSDYKPDEDSSDDSLEYKDDDELEKEANDNENLSQQQKVQESGGKDEQSTSQKSPLKDTNPKEAAQQDVNPSVRATDVTDDSGQKVLTAQAQEKGENSGARDESSDNVDNCGMSTEKNQGVVVDPKDLSGQDKDKFEESGRADSDTKINVGEHKKLFTKEKSPSRRKITTYNPMQASYRLSPEQIAQSKKAVADLIPITTYLRAEFQDIEQPTVVMNQPIRSDDRISESENVSSFSENSMGSEESSDGKNGLLYVGFGGAFVKLVNDQDRPDQCGDETVGKSGQSLEAQQEVCSEQTEAKSTASPFLEHVETRGSEVGHERRRSRSSSTDVDTGITISDVPNEEEILP